MKSTYNAVEVSAPGVLRVVEREISAPGAGQVRMHRPTEVEGVLERLSRGAK
jgi:hypothetical protein